MAFAVIDACFKLFALCVLLYISIEKITRINFDGKKSVTDISNLQLQLK